MGRMMALGTVRNVNYTADMGGVMALGTESVRNATYMGSNGRVDGIRDGKKYHLHGQTWAE